MAFRTTPQLGPQLNQVFTGLPYWDNPGPLLGSSGTIATGITSPSYKLGNKEVGDDGHDYVWVRASANIASNAAGIQVTITEPAFTVATGAGGYWTPPNTAIVSGQYFHVRKGIPGQP